MYVGEILKTDMSDKTVVIQVNEGEKINAVLWDGRQYIVAAGITKDTEDRYTWQSGKYTNSLITASALMELNKEDVKNTVDILMTEHYAEFFKALIGTELNIEDKEILDNIYTEYMNDDDFELLSFELTAYAQDLKDEKYKKEEEFTL